MFFIRRSRHRASLIFFLVGFALLLVVGIWGALTHRIPDIASGDAICYYLPGRVFTVRSLMSWTLPKWNPYVYTGLPHIADIQTGAFYLPNIVFYSLLRPAVAFDVSMAFNVLLMAFFMSRLLCLLVRNECAVWIGTATFTFSTFMANNAGTVTVVDSASWVPVAFWCTERWLATGKLRYCMWGGVCLAMQLLAGWPQFVLLTAIYLTVYLLFALPQHSRPGRALIGFVLIGVISAGVGMAQLLPTLAFKDQTIVEKLTFPDFIYGSVPPQLTVLMLFPFLVGAGYGDLLHTLHKVPYFGPINGQVTAYYLGILPLLLAVTAMFRWRPSRVVRTAAAMAALACVLTWTGYLPTARLLYRIPGINFFHDHRINIAFIAFSVALLAAIGADALVSEELPYSLRRKLGWMLPVLLVTLAAVVLIKIRAILASINPTLNAIPEGWVPKLHQVMRFNSPDLMVSIGVLLASAALFWYWGHHPQSARTAALVALFVAADLLYCGMSPNWFSTRVEPSSDEASAMQAMRQGAHGQEFRSLSLVRGTHPPISPNLNSIYDHADISGLGPLLPKRHADLLTSATSAFVRWPELMVNNTVLSVLNTRYVEVDGDQLTAIERMLGPFSNATMHPPIEASRQNLFDGVQWNTGDTPEEIHADNPDLLAIRETGLKLDPNSAYELSFDLRFSDPKDWYGLGVGFVADDSQDYYSITHWMLEGGSDFHHYHRLFLTGSNPGKVEIKLFTMTTSPIYLKNITLVRVGAFPLGNPYKLLGSFGSLHVLENTRAGARAFFVSRLQPASAYIDARAALWQTAEPFDIADTALVEAAQERLPQTLGQGRVEYLRYSQNRADLDVSCDGTCFLVLADMNAPGWKATVDGRLTPIYRTNGMLRGIVIGSGRHEVVFQYAPWAISVGLLLSLATLGLVTLVTVVSWRRERGHSQAAVHEGISPAARA